MPHGLSKSRLMAFRQCPKRLWLSLHRPELQQTSVETEQRFHIGFQVGEIARGLHPAGVFIDTADPGAALALTRRALAEHPRKPLFEAAFQRDGVLIRADLLLPEAGGYRLREVKASTEVKPEHYEDCAIQAWVVGETVPLTAVELAHVDNTFVYPGGGNYHGLLKPNTLDADLVDILSEVPHWVAAARATLAGSEPAMTPGGHCHTPHACPLDGYCSAGQARAEYPLGCLPSLRGRRLAGLEQVGIEDVRDIPDDYGLTDHQARVARVIKSGKPECDPVAATIMQCFAYPRYYLDFETIQVAVPLWAGTRPYQFLLVQWSCHTETAPGVLEHRAFLADGADDPRRAFVEGLLASVGDTGPIFVYHSAFELGRLRELLAVCPDRAADLTAVIERVEDLLPITRQHYCHPAMKGRWSLKAVLPTLAPELAYDQLDIGDGGAATGAWQEIYHPDTAAERRVELRQAVADYCERDTLALVRLAWFFEGTPAGLRAG